MQATNPEAVQSSGNPAHQTTTGINTVNKAVDLTNTVAAIVKEVGEVLQHVPYVKALSGVILQFIKIREELKMNKERCREIIDKVLGLSHWIYDKLDAIAKSGERVKENLAQVESSLNFCASTLTNVSEELQKHQSKPKLAKFINRGLEDLNKLDRLVDNLEKRLVRDIVFDIKLQQDIPTQSKNMDPASNILSSVHGHVLPPKPYLMVERQAQVVSALNILLGPEPSRIAILGGGGFGKTTLARSLLHEPQIIERYTIRFFLSCEGMADVEALLLGFGNMLGINTSPSAILASARRKLMNSTTLLCLDNFETIWEPSTTRTKVEELLASIADIPNLSLVITTRGTQRPSKVEWTHPLLPPLSTVSSESAQKILQTICGPNYIIDEPTQNLIDAVDGIPLAIILISNLLRDGETSHALWARWSKEQTKMVENGGDDRESNLNASITLSIHSPRIKKDPVNITLLTALSLLPDGFPVAAIGQLEKYLDINGIHKALQTLRAVALIKPNEANPFPRIRMLSPIRLFCLAFLSSNISLTLESVVNFYINMILQAGNSHEIAELYALIVPEIPNLHSVFQRVYKAGYSQDITRLIDATSCLTDWSNYVGYLTQDTIQMAIESSVNFPILHARCLVSLGDLYSTEGRYARAESHYREAARLFKNGNNLVGEALTLEKCGSTLSDMQRFDEAEVTLKTSFELYTRANHPHGLADVLLGLGGLYVNKMKYSEAEVTLKSALEAYKRTSNLIGQANAATSLTQLHLSHVDLVEAEEYATKALDAAKRANFAHGEGDALRWLGSIYLAVDRLPDARRALEQALTISKQQSNPVNQLNTINYLAKVYIQSDQLAAAEALLTAAKMDLDVIQTPDILNIFGWLYICSDHLNKAEFFLDNALKNFRKFNDKGGWTQALVHLGTIYLKSNRLDKAEQTLKSIPDLGIWYNVKIRRLWVLGELYTIKGELEDAAASLDAAMACCQNAGYSYSYQQGNILRSMGTLHVKQGRINLAVEKFKMAREFHIKAQWVSEQATDLKRLGEAYEMLERTEEAEVVFKEVEVLMESVREARTLKE